MTPSRPPFALTAALAVLITPAFAPGTCRAADGCGLTVGLLGNPRLELRPFLASHGIGSRQITTAAFLPAALDPETGDVDVVYVLRDGADIARAGAATLDAWLRGGGTLLTEFRATQVLHEPGPLGYLGGELVDDFWVPSGDPCGGNGVRVEDPDHPLAEGLPPGWSCSGNPVAVFQVFDGVDPRLCVVASIPGSDRDGDGREDPLVGVLQVGQGRVVAFHSDFGNWSPLEDPRACSSSGPDCRRTVEEEVLLLNAICRPGGCACGSCADLLARVEAAAIDREGVRRSLAAKAEAACRALARGRREAAGGVLCALLNELRALRGRQVTAAAADEIRTCVLRLAAANEVRVGPPEGGCGAAPVLAPAATARVQAAPRRGSPPPLRRR